MSLKDTALVAILTITGIAYIAIMVSIAERKCARGSEFACGTVQFFVGANR